MSNHKILITGATGRLGKLLYQKLNSLNYNVIGTTHQKHSGMCQIDLAHSFFDLYHLIEREKPSIIFHTAAMISQSDPIQQYSTNISMIVHLTEAIGRVKTWNSTPLFINLSSAAEIGNISNQDLPVHEAYICKPITSYGASKLCQTEIALSAARKYGFRAVCARIFNILNLPDSPDHLVQSWINQIKGMTNAESSQILRVGDTSITRDFLDVEEVIEILIQLATCPDAQGIINIASGIETRLSQILDHLRTISGIPFKTEASPSFIRTTDVYRLFASTEKLTSLLQRPIVFNLEKSLRKMFPI